MHCSGWSTLEGVRKVTSLEISFVQVYNALASWSQLLQTSSCVQMQVAVYMPEDPITCAWRGGAMLAASLAFGQMTVTRQAYEEEGAARMHTMAADD